MIKTATREEIEGRRKAFIANDFDRTSVRRAISTRVRAPGWTGLKHVTAGNVSARWRVLKLDV